MKSIVVSLYPFQSCFIVFNKSGNPDRRRSSEISSFPVKAIVQALDGPWDVSFDPAWGGPSGIVFDTLADWTKRPEDSIKYYSGIASYRKTFDFPEYVNLKHSELILNLGSVKNLAAVSLNGTDLGTVWTSPFHVRITGVIRRNNNKLKIDVANLWANRLIGDESEPWDGVENGKWPEWLINGTQRPSRRYTFTTHRYYKNRACRLVSGKKLNYLDENPARCYNLGNIVTSSPETFHFSK